jgi:hypothetical protein
VKLVLHDENIMDSKQSSIGPKTHWSIHMAELIGIYLALELIPTVTPGTIFSGNHVNTV